MALVPRNISRIGRERFPCGIADGLQTQCMRVFETMTRSGFEGSDLHLAHYTLPSLHLGHLCTRNRVRTISQQRSVIQTRRAPVSTINRPQYPSRRASADSYPTPQFPTLSTPFDHSLTWLPNGKGGSAKSVTPQAQTQHKCPATVPPYSCVHPQVPVAGASAPKAPGDHRHQGFRQRAAPTNSMYALCTLYRPSHFRSEIRT